MCFYRNYCNVKHEYVLSYKDTFYNRQLQQYQYQPNWSHVNDYHRSRRSILKGFTRDFYRKRKATFLQGIYFRSYLLH